NSSGGEVGSDGSGDVGPPALGGRAEGSGGQAVRTTLALIDAKLALLVRRRDELADRVDGLDQLFAGPMTAAVSLMLTPPSWPDLRPEDPDVGQSPEPGPGPGRSLTRQENTGASGDPPPGHGPEGIAWLVTRPFPGLLLAPLIWLDARPRRKEADAVAWRKPG